MINEEMARNAKMLNSFGDYKEGSATSEYNQMCTEFSNNVKELKERFKSKLTPEKDESIEYYTQRYFTKLANAINEGNRIESYCPSVLICGAGNFSVRKKKRQNEMRDNWQNKYSSLFDTTNNYYFKKIFSLLSDSVIYSSDELAVEKLQDKIAELKKLQEYMKSANAYYRKHNTMVGFDTLTDEEAEEYNQRIQDDWYKVPYASFSLSNNNQEIHRLQERVESIQKLKARANQSDENKYITIEGLEVTEDATDMRIRIVFDDIPSQEVREILKSNGFKWSPKNSAWQRQLTTNGIYATKRVLNEIKEMM